MSDSEEETSVDLYEVLGITKEAASSEPDAIKKAYRRKALQTHPDKAKDEAQKAEFHEKFQAVALAYAVLSDPKRKKRYDESGDTDDFESDETIQEFMKELYKSGITTEMIEEDKKMYQNSPEEQEDIIAAYKEFKGDMDLIFENIVHSDIEKDEQRFRSIIEEAIKNKEVKRYKLFKDTEEKKVKRIKTAKKEAEEAEELANKIGLKQNSTEDDLAAIIRKRQQSRFGSLVDKLEEKYAPKAKKKAKK